MLPGRRFNSFSRASNEYTNSDSPALLCDIIQLSSLPQRLLITESVYGTCMTTDFIHGAMIDVHFCKETVFANVQLKSGKKLKVPINAKFTMDIFENAEVKARARTVSSSQLMKMSMLPTIVTVAECSKSTAFAKREVLIMLQKAVNCRSVECYSLLTKTKKTISKSSTLQLRVDPVHFNLHFADVIQHLPLPLIARLLPGDKRCALHFQEHCKILSLGKQKSVIASFCGRHDSVSQLIAKREIFEIVTTVDLNFLQVKLTDNEHELLVKKSKALYDAFTPVYIKKVITNLKALNPDIDQLLYEMHENGEQMMSGVSIIPINHPKPPACLSPKEKQVPSLAIMPAASTGTPSMTVQQGSTDTCTQQHEYETLQDYLAPVKNDLPTAVRHVETVKDANPGTQQYLNIPLHKTESNQQQEKQSSRSIDINVKLESIDQKKVLEVLDNLGLAQYKDIFVEQKVSGSLLQECTEDILREDFKITSKLHRLKLMRVIAGREPLAPLLNPTEN